MRYTVEGITGSQLVDAQGRLCGPESTGTVYGKYKTREKAEAALANRRRHSPLVPAAVFERESK